MQVRNLLDLNHLFYVKKRQNTSFTAQKNAPFLGRLFVIVGRRLELRYIRSLWTTLSFYDVKFHTLTFF
jgi:hypothetical protein